VIDALAAMTAPPPLLLQLLSLLPTLRLQLVLALRLLVH
jgi:hypothetical protein